MQKWSKKIPWAWGGFGLEYEEVEIMINNNINSFNLVEHTQIISLKNLFGNASFDVL